MAAGGVRELAHRVAGIVLAGGQGTRLFPLTQSRCKPAVGFGGRYRLIDIPLSNALNSKIEQLYVISQYLASDLNHHIVSTFRVGQIEILSPEENASKKIWFQGTADAIRQNVDHFKKASADYFLILSGDQLYNINFDKMITFAESTKADLVVAALHVDEAEAKRMGVMLVNSKAEITHFHEKPQERADLDRLKTEKGHLGSMGIYVFRREALFALLQEKGNDFGHDLIPAQVKKGNARVFIYDGYWVDIGTVGSFYEANMALLDQKECLDTYDEENPIFTRAHNLPSPMIKHAVIKNSLISQGAIIDAKEIDHSVIGIRSHVKEGTVITNSILMGHHFYLAPKHQSPPLPKEFSIGKNCLIKKAIIDEHCRIGDNVRLINEKNLTNFDGNGVYIRDGIMIVTTGTSIPDNFVL